MSSGRDEPAPPGELELDDIWPPAGRARRPGSARRHEERRRSPLSRAEIVRAALTVADAEGAGAINMRRIARELDAGTMSLYWHVADKNHLLDLMLDAVESEEEIGPASGNWHEDLALLARRQHQALLRHPWVVDFVGGRPSLGPHVILRLEQSLALLDDLGLDARTAVDILSTLNTYVLGAVIRELREMRNDHDLESLGHTRPSLELEFRDWQLRLRASGRFARFLRIFDEDVDPDDPATRNERFEFGLRCVLDGIAAAVARRAPRP